MTPYPAYKPTDLPWLPKIPEHWKLVRNKNVLSEQKDIVGEQASQYDLLSLTLSGVILRDMENCKGKFPAEFDSYKIIRPGNIIFCLFDIDETPRGVGLSPHAGMITGAYDVFSINIAEPRFLFYYYLNIDNQKALKPYYTGLRKVVTVSRFLGLQFPVPPPEEQAQIVRYLDSMTAKINKLIRAKKKQIALLEEQKQAVISQAVSKGLDPNAEMKDSGIDWLGKIPKHWEIKRLGHFSSLQNGISAPAEYFGSGFPFMTYGDVYNNYELPQNLTGLAMSSAEDQARYSVQEGDVFFTRTSETIEEIAFASTCIKPIPHAIFSGFLIRVRPNKKVIRPLFSKYYFRCILLRNYFVKEINSVIRASLSQQLLRNLPVLLPPVVEQEKIAQHLELNSNSFHEAIKIIENEIVSLVEYKNSLISSVVTGQVDIRNIPVDDFDPADLVSETEDDSEKEKNIINASEE